MPAVRRAVLSSLTLLELSLVSILQCRDTRLFSLFHAVICDHFLSVHSATRSCAAQPGWLSAHQSPSEYLQIDMQQPHVVSGLLLQGCPGGWTTRVSLTISLDGNVWQVRHFAE